MYQSIPSLTIPRAHPRGIFLKGRIPHKESAKPRPWGRKIVLKLHSQSNYFRKFSKKTKHETEIMKNICLEILKQ